MNPVTPREVWAWASNAAVIANCGCPSRYFNTKWEPVWRRLKAEWEDHFLKGGPEPKIPE